jgi:hypothetical protein
MPYGHARTQASDGVRGGVRGVPLRERGVGGRHPLCASSCSSRASTNRVSAPACSSFDLVRSAKVTSAAGLTSSAPRSSIRKKPIVRHLEAVRRRRVHRDAGQGGNAPREARPMPRSRGRSV